MKRLKKKKILVDLSVLKETKYMPTFFFIYRIVRYYIIWAVDYAKTIHSERNFKKKLVWIACQQILITTLN